MGKNLINATSFRQFYSYSNQKAEKKFYKTFWININFGKVLKKTDGLIPCQIDREPKVTQKLLKLKFLGIEKGILILRNMKIMNNPMQVDIRRINTNLLLVIFRIYLKLKQKIKIQLKKSVIISFYISTSQ